MPDIGDGGRIPGGSREIEPGQIRREFGPDLEASQGVGELHADIRLPEWELDADFR